MHFPLHTASFVYPFIVAASAFAAEPSPGLRWADAPPAVIKELNRREPRRDHSIYAPDAADLGRAERAVAELPRGLQHKLATRLRGLCLVNQLAAGGAMVRVDGADWLAIDAETLPLEAGTYLAATWMRWFSLGDPNVECAVEVSGRKPAITYLLAREGIRHLLAQGAIDPSRLAGTGWIGDTRPAAPFEFPERLRFDIAGDNETAPSFDQAPRLLGLLERTPFVSPLAARSRLDDLSELGAFACLAGSGGGVIISIKRESPLPQVRYRHAPLTRPEIAFRAARLMAELERTPQ